MNFKAGQLTEKFAGELIRVALNPAEMNIALEGYLVDDDDAYIYLSSTNNVNEIDASILKSSGIFINRLNKQKSKSEYEQMLDEVEEPENDNGYN